MLDQLGWVPFFSDAFEALGDSSLSPARVSVQHNYLFRVLTESEELLASTAGSLKHAASSQAALPGVGDWVAIKVNPEGPATMLHVLPRRTCFSRKAAGPATAEQVIASNIDTVFLVSGLDGDFNPKRVERYLVAATDSGATPVVVLNKVDLCDHLDDAVAAIRDLSPNVSIHATNGRDGTGLDQLAQYLRLGHTVAFLGSSGVGKSTLINGLLGRERQRTQEVRGRDSRGRHTTVHRELILHPDGGVIIDTPGMRELRLWDKQEGVATTFDDIERLSDGCRFRDCRHRTEPGCAVQQAVADSRISTARLTHYHQLQDERALLNTRRDGLAELLEKQAVKPVRRRPKR